MTPTPRDPEKICRYYQPISSHDSCEASVIYNDLAIRLNVRRGYVRAICMGRCQGCTMYSPFTAQEIEVADKSLAARLIRIARARAKVVEKAFRKRGVFGSMSCPICHEGTLTWSVSEHNATRTAGKCSKPNCVQWREYQ